MQKSEAEENVMGEHKTGSSRFLEAARCRNSGRPPVWLMRQAGRYLPEYQAIKKNHSFVEMCSDPELAFEVSMQPYRLFGLDAVVVFYDILFLAEAMGAPLEYNPGPRFLEPLRTAQAIAALEDPDPAGHTAPVLETIARLRAELPLEVAVLGFAGSPFTMAAYLVEGNFSRSGEWIKRLMNQDPELLHALLASLARATGSYLRAQLEAGADAVQLFDTWAGLLSGEDYRRFALPYQDAVFAAIADLGAPAILYVNGASHLLDEMASSGAGVLSVDWRTGLREARGRLGPEIGLQGNLDPSLLFGEAENVRIKTDEILDEMSGDPGFIFNLGHGVLPETPVESVRALVETVQARAG